MKILGIEYGEEKLQLGKNEFLIETWHYRHRRTAAPVSNYPAGRVASLLRALVAAAARGLGFLRGFTLIQSNFLNNFPLGNFSVSSEDKRLWNKYVYKYPCRKANSMTSVKLREGD